MNKLFFSLLIFVGTIQAFQHEIINTTNKDINITLFETSPRGNAMPTLTIKPGSNFHDSQEKCITKMKLEGIEKMVNICGSSKITITQKNGAWQVLVEKIMPSAKK